MINLYQILHISPYASEAEIRAALNKMETGLNERTIKAVYEWLLVDAVRARYDMKLRQAYPEYFAQYRQENALAAPKPTHANKRIVMKNAAKSSGKTIKIKKKTELSAADYRADVPELWNPTVAVSLCLLLYVYFGAILHALNWSELGEEKLARDNWIFAVISAVLVLCAFVFGKVFAVVHLIFLFVWYFALGQKQVTYIKTELNNTYRSKGWVVPIVIGVLTMFGLIFLAVILEALLGIE